ncbi:ComEA family DNA-binding protein [Cellulophaga tyrosinoxydans]|uniref:DNA uptake protein ComE n=1 Tax=Cellulophaga tyrosinoxydans TaxID=504486 RepID=A0A1W1Y5P6_9FLAO|nr:helix-hairpin-helix domain-containing protein [Cellulophaga tyrosinoxydans]SMC31530.1 DNA uptake protein ComE [Cellulophaga tyrosinoxydans]
MNKFKSHFKFNKQERSGIFFLLAIIVLLQLVYAFSTSIFQESTSVANKIELDGVAQEQINILKERTLENDSLKIYPFNPNYITDYRGYKLGMSTQEIDRLHLYRSSNKFVNSAEEFQNVTLISDSLLQKIAPYFKFPEWVKSTNSQKSFEANVIKFNKKPNVTNTVKDLNTASAQDLKVIYGIGEKLATRIIKFRDRLGGFLIEDQLYDVYGLKPEVAQKVLMKFKVQTKPEIVKINVNTANASEISKLVYLNYQVSSNIVAYRKQVGEIKSIDELKKIEGFPSDKINRITLYLTLKEKL